MRQILMYLKAEQSLSVEKRLQVDAERKSSSSDPDKDLGLHCSIHLKMSLVLRKPVFGVSDQVQDKPGCTTTEDS